MPASPPTDSPADAEAANVADAVNQRSLSLMSRVKTGDETAFAELVTLHQQAAVGAAFRMLGSLEDAHDVAQQVFVRIWRSAPRYEPTAKFTTWMFTILRNLVFNEQRRRSRQHLQSIEAQGEAFGHEVEDATTPQPDAGVSQRELEEAVDRAIQTLPENQRLAVSLRRGEDLPYEQIAEIMEISLSAVKSLLFRARNELKEKLKNFLD
ncbi:MAG: sigma-70 family RNA polymerase sigma factor [Verrucomicrobiales bacterium]|nr:sigma-70 family RNA polymerase sigma factor [Verrucomicrobiales bacterium]